VASLDRTACRAHVERHFSPAVMADGYEAVYRRVMGWSDDEVMGSVTFSPAPN